MSAARRARYAGRNPRAFSEKYKELDPARYPSDVRKILASGKTPAGTHLPIMVDEILDALQPMPGEVAVDCTLGGGGHALAILERIRPGGRLIGLDIDPFELPRTETRLRTAGFGPETFSAHLGNFAGLPRALAENDVSAADLILADLGVSSMQLDNPERGFSFRESGPLDMRMNPLRGEPASRLLWRLSEQKLADLLETNADEPHARLIASLLKEQLPVTTQELGRRVHLGLTQAPLGLTKPEVKMSVRRTFQALRIAVNDEFSALDALLRSFPMCVAPGGRVVVLTFHSGEDRRVKKAFQTGYRDGVYSAVASEVIRATYEETRANRRASSAKLRWAVRAAASPTTAATIRATDGGTDENE
ncbi:MAG TPA: 16S rRNA (cytosine(1402)-N(4))-methyltransferase RsmH [Vicinamibacterales bacterium]|nr:16S rRNA (cytosine(1402)-N(4))-methyltransferase RsmH [Vicinamibacterales bacterium]